MYFLVSFGIIFLGEPMSLCESGHLVVRVEGWVYEPGVGLNLMEVPQGLKARCITGTRVRALVRVKTTGLSSLKG